MDEKIYNDIIKAFEDAYKPTTNVEANRGPSYLLSDGRFIYLDNVHVRAGSDRHWSDKSMHSDEREYLILKMGFDKGEVNAAVTKYLNGALSLNDGAYRGWETVIRIQRFLEPTHIQYQQLKVWLENILFNPGNREFVNVCVIQKSPISSENEYHGYNKYAIDGSIDADYIIDRIKKYYSMGKLLESAEQEYDFKTIKQALIDSKHFPIGEIDETGFILPDGDFLNTADNTFSMPWHNSVEGYLQEIGMDDEDAEWVSNQNDSGDGAPTIERFGAIRVSAGENYICLPPIRPTEAAFDTLNKWLDKYLEAYSWADSVPPIYVTNYEGNVDNSYGATDDIVKKCKRYYSSHQLVENKLNEETLESEHFDVKVTTSPYELKAWLLNSSDAQRVFIDERHGIYLMGNMYECVHMDMIELAQENGLEVKYNDYDPKQVCIIYVPISDEYFNEEGDAVSDRYDYAYYYDDFTIYSRYNPFTNYELYKVFGKPFKTKNLYMNEASNDSNVNPDKYTDNILKWLEHNIGLSNKPNMAGASYIFPDGRYLQINDGPWKDEYPDDDKYDTHEAFDYYIQENIPELATYVDEGGYIIDKYFNPIRTNNFEQYIICSSKNRPTSAQLKALTDWLEAFHDYLINNNHGNGMFEPSKLQVVFGFDHENYGGEAVVDITKNEPKDIIKMINTYYNSGNIIPMNESASSKMVVYHGTDKADIKAFNHAENWFSPSWDYAHYYAVSLNDVGYIYKCEISLGKNLNVGATGARAYSLLPLRPYRFSEEAKALFKQLGLDEKEARTLLSKVTDEYRLPEDGYKMKISTIVRSKAFVDILKAKGYDSVSTIEHCVPTNEDVDCYGIINPSLIKIIGKEKVVYGKSKPVQEAVEVYDEFTPQLEKEMIKDLMRFFNNNTNEYIGDAAYLTKGGIYINLDEYHENGENRIEYFCDKHNLDPYDDYEAKAGLIHCGSSYYNYIYVSATPTTEQIRALSSFEEYNLDKGKDIELDCGATQISLKYDGDNFCYRNKNGVKTSIARELVNFYHLNESILNEVKYTKEPPKKTGKAYKVFRVKNGKLYPPMVANVGGTDTPVGVWLDAEEGEFAGLSKTGRKQVKSTVSGDLSYRPGYHLGDIPRAAQFDRAATWVEVEKPADNNYKILKTLNSITNKATEKHNGEIYLVKENNKFYKITTDGNPFFPYDFVWGECDYAMDVDYQKDADEQGYIRTKMDDKGNVTTTRSNKFQHSLAGLQKLPDKGYYKYRTNPNPDTVPWVITGQMKVNRLLSDDEVNTILKKEGIAPIHRQGGDKTLAELGLSNK